MNLLYICHGNMARSPAAEQITHAKCPELNVSSAGIIEVQRIGMSLEMSTALTQLGYRRREHRPKQLTSELLSSQDLVLCMERSQVDFLRSVYNGKVCTLPEFAGSPGVEIPDPDELIRRVPEFYLFSRLPYRLRSMVYGMLRQVDPRDSEGVLHLHLGIARNIEKYVDLALQRLRKEGILPK